MPSLDNMWWLLDILTFGRFFMSVKSKPWLALCDDLNRRRSFCVSTKYSFLVFENKVVSKVCVTAPICTIALLSDCLLDILSDRCGILELEDETELVRVNPDILAADEVGL